MIKLYIIRRQDIFEAIGKKQLPDRPFIQCGSIWAFVHLTLDERQKYNYPCVAYE